ncbi:MAG: protein TolR [Gammaproteobacteria bacterium]|nr:protein TolR [Gammaproteobacteria bacterium]MDQ7075684.1 protein TolR [Gammaproteobacteria bacterium]
MARSRDKRRKPMAEINVVPYIDVMLVLLVIFMITAPLLQSGVEVSLPQATANVMPETKTEPLLLTVSLDGSLYLNIAQKPKQVLTEEQVLALVEKALRLQPKRQVLVRGDKNVAYGLVVRAMVLLQQGGAQQVGLVTEAAEP